MSGEGQLGNTSVGKVAVGKIGSQENLETNHSKNLISENYIFHRNFNPPINIRETWSDTSSIES